MAAGAVLKRKITGAMSPHQILQEAEWRNGRIEAPKAMSGGDQVWEGVSGVPPQPTRGLGSGRGVSSPVGSAWCAALAGNAFWRILKASKRSFAPMPMPIL